MTAVQAYTSSRFVDLQANAFYSLNVDKPADLKGGIWYPFQYCEQLKMQGEIKKLKEFIKKGFCLYGFAPESAFITPRSYLHIIKDTIKPSRALDQLKQGPSAIDCGMALNLSFLIALRDYIGKKKFNALFSASSYPLHLERAKLLPPLFSRVAISDETEIQPGDFCYFSNLPDYKGKHPFGEAMGYNVVHVGSDRYMGFGLPANGTSAQGIQQVLCDSYHRTPFDASEYLNKKERERYYESQKDSQPPISNDCMTLLKKSLYLAVRRPRWDRIEMLRETPVDQISSLFQQWRQQIS